MTRRPPEMSDRGDGGDARRRPRAGLDTARVVQEAAALVDAEGVEALTLARLAERLQVRTPSLYNHVAGLDAVRRAVTRYGLRLQAEALRDATIGRAGDDALFALADAYRTFAKQRPGLYALTMRTVVEGDAETRAVAEELLEIVLAALVSYGLSAEDGIHAVRGLRSAMHGFVSLELMGEFGRPESVDESFRRLIATLARGLRTSGAHGV